MYLSHVVAIMYYEGGLSDICIMLLHSYIADGSSNSG